MRYGASTPEALVERAAEHGQPALALTDRDGLYGAVRFAMAAGRAGIAPVLGVDLAVDLPAGLPGSRPPASRGIHRAGPVRTPVRGGAVVDPRRPRVVVLARGHAAPGSPTAGGGRPWPGSSPTPTSVASGAPRSPPPGSSPGPVPARRSPGAPSRLLVLLGPDSDVGRALLLRRRDVARARLAAWQALLPPDALADRGRRPRRPRGDPGVAGPRRRPARPRRRGRGARPSSPPRSATSTPAASAPSTSSTPPAGSSCSTPGTSIG